MINELIEQIGGRARLEAIVYAVGAEPCDADPILDSVTHGHVGNMARALLAVMDAKPIAYTHESEISNMHVTGLYIRGFPIDRRLNADEGYTVPLYTTPPAPSAPEGWRMVPVEPNWAMLNAAINFHEGEAFLPASLYKAMLAAAPAPGDEK